MANCGETLGAAVQKSLRHTGAQKAVRRDESIREMGRAPRRRSGSTSWHHFALLAAIFAINAGLAESVNLPELPSAKSIWNGLLHAVQVAILVAVLYGMVRVSIKMGHASFSAAWRSALEAQKRVVSRARKRVTSRPVPQVPNGADGGADAMADVESNRRVGAGGGAREPVDGGGDNGGADAMADVEPNRPVGAGGGAREPVDGGGVNLAENGGVAGDAAILVEGSPHGINRIGGGGGGGGSGNDGDGGGVNPTQDDAVAVSTLIMGLALPCLLLGDFLTPREAVLFGVFVMLSFVVDGLHQLGFLHRRIKLAMYSITWFFLGQGILT